MPICINMYRNVSRETMGKLLIGEISIELGFKLIIALWMVPHSKSGKLSGEVKTEEVLKRIN